MRTLKALAALAAAAALATGSAAAQQTSSDTGTDANGPITILKNMVAEPDGVRVEIDGREVEHLNSATYTDITGTVHPGANVLTVRWRGPLQRLWFTIAYAPTRNNFRNVLVVRSDAAHDSTLRAAGARTLTFRLPG